MQNLGFTYDAVGNVTNDGNNSYGYNTEGLPVTLGSYQTLYGAFNRAVDIQGPPMGAWTEIVYGPDGYKFAKMRAQAVSKYIAPLAGGLQAVYTAITPAAPGYWRHADWLGSSRIASTATQTVYYDGAYAPFGENYVETGNTDRSFTGQTQDTTYGLYDFLFRKQSPVQGRWLRPDPLGTGAVDITNPQTWNRYAYLFNSPLNATDPLGLYDAVLGCMGGPLACGIGVDGGGGDWSSNDASQGVGTSGSGSTSGSSDDVDCGWVCHFFSGQFSGVWSQTDVNNWQLQKLFQGVQLEGGSAWSYLPQNQNPKAQSAIWESAYQSGLPPMKIPTGTGGTLLIPVSAPPWPTHLTTTFSSNKIPKACTMIYTRSIKSCESLPPGPERDACIEKAREVLSSCL